MILFSFPFPFELVDDVADCIFDELIVYLLAPDAIVMLDFAFCFLSCTVVYHKSAAYGTYFWYESFLSHGPFSSFRDLQFFFGTILPV